jgi:hypothetical protein
MTHLAVNYHLTDNVCTPGYIYSGIVTERLQNVPKGTKEICADPSIDSPVFVTINENDGVLFSPKAYRKVKSCHSYLQDMHSFSAVGKYRYMSCRNSLEREKTVNKVYFSHFICGFCILLRI